MVSLLESRFLQGNAFPTETWGDQCVLDFVKNVNEYPKQNNPVSGVVLVHRAGIEPTAKGLRVPCSTAELPMHKGSFLRPQLCQKD